MTAIVLFVMALILLLTASLGIGSFGPIQFLPLGIACAVGACLAHLVAAP